MHSDKKKNQSQIDLDYGGDIFAQNKISMKDIDNYLSQNQMNFNFNDNLFGGFDEDIEKEIMNLRKGAPNQQSEGPKDTKNKSSEKDLEIDEE